MTTSTLTRTAEIDADLYHLLVEVRGALAKTFSQTGHLLMTNHRESGGFCGWRQHSPLCVAQTDLFLRLDTWLTRIEDGRGAPPRAEQGELWEGMG